MEIKNERGLGDTLKLHVLVPFLFLLFYLSVHTVIAADFNSSISAEDKAAFDQMLFPIMKIYNFLKYSASVIAVMFILFAGITYIMSGNDFKKRDNAKNMVAYVLVGLAVIWAAPFAVSYIIS